MKKNAIFQKYIIFLPSAVVCILILISCAKLIPVKPPDEKYPPLEKVYKKIILQKFEVAHDLQKEYPQIILTCEATAMNELLKYNAAPIIQKAHTSTSRETHALIVRTRITRLRLASSSALSVTGAPREKSAMTAEVLLIDAKTRNALRKITLSTADIPTSPGLKVSEREMPSVLGKLIAEYIAKSVSPY
ncbi:MAG TPA: hypothetical protein ENN23_07745 [Deltaproteobacteria bacterium]|nr:hypothetical protein [Deltaproteobacteria bacterium]